MARLRGFLELLVAIQGQDRALHRRSRGDVQRQAAGACAVNDRGIAIELELTCFARREGGRDANAFEPVLFGVLLFAETDHRHPLRLEAGVAVGVVVNDRNRRGLATDFTIGDKSRNLSAERRVHGTGGAAGPGDTLEQVNYEQWRVDIGDRRMLNAELHLVASSFYLW